MLDLQQYAMVTHALVVCCLHPTFQETNIAVYLLHRGMPFHTLQDTETLQHLSSAHARDYEPPFCPSNYVFVLRDYAAYHDQCEAAAKHLCAHTALLQGGYLWRVTIPWVIFERVLAGPSGLSPNLDGMFVVTVPNGKQYVDDS